MPPSESCSASRRMRASRTARWVCQSVRWSMRERSTTAGVLGSGSFDADASNSRADSSSRSLLGVIDLLDQPLQVGRCFLGHGASPTHGLGVEAGAVAERGEPLVADPAHLEPHVRDLVQLLAFGGSVDPSPRRRRCRAARRPRPAPPRAERRPAPSDAEPRPAPRIAGLPSTSASSVSAASAFFSASRAIVSSSSRVARSDRASVSSGVSSPGLTRGREPEVARTDRRRSAQLVDVRRRQRRARRAGVVDPDVRSALLVGDHRPGDRGRRSR